MINKKKFIFILTILLFLPLISAANYGEGLFGARTFGVAEVSEDSNGGSSSSSGGTSTTISGCSQSSDCGENQYCFENTCFDAQCLDDSVCNVGTGEVCWNYQCVKLFDVEILEFESPVKIGEFFNFTYFLKAVAEINGDVEINFWIEQEGNIITSGHDTIYFGSFEEKTKTKKLFLPKEISSGTYNFYIEVTHGTYTASAHRTIGINVKDGLATIKISSDFKTYIIYGLVGLSILIAVLSVIFYLRKKLKIKGKAEHAKYKKRVGKNLKKIVN